MDKIIINCVVFGYDEGVLKVLLTKNDISSNAKWGTVSGALKNGENTDEAAVRVLIEHDIEKKLLLRQYKTFVNFESDPTKNTVTIGYYALINMKDYKINYSRINTYKKWKDVREVKDLLFGHSQMLDLAFYQLNKSLRELSIMFCLLPEKFTLNELSKLCQQIFGLEIDEMLLYKKMVQQRVLVKIEGNQKVSIANFYKFNQAFYEKKSSENFLYYL
ncbi:NrtR DNA-binding winged helix domain-containing protein [Flavobacterium sp. 3-210]